MRLLILLFTFLFSITSVAYTRQFQDWTTDVGSDYAESYVHNDTGSIMGFYCTSTGCMTYFELLNVTCKNSQITQLLVVTNKDSLHANGTCVVLSLNNKIRYVHRIDLPDIVTLMQQGSFISIAMPLEGGQIKVGRFSLAGYKEAVYLASTTTYKGGNKNYRDTTY